MAQHWAEVGFGTPVALHLFYAGKVLLYILGGRLIVLSTPGIDGFTEAGAWWSEPIVFQKIVLYTMLFEVVGLGCGFGPLDNRYFPPMGSCLYWLRPRTIRLPPWPGRIPLTSGTARTPVDVALYAALLLAMAATLFADGTGPVPALGTTVGLLPVWPVVVILALLAVLGLRDRVIFLAARGEVYGTLTLTFLCTGADTVIAAELVFVVIWMGAATSKLNKHFPFVVSMMMSNSPVVRMPADREDEYVLTDGERICSTALGWNFGDGHLHSEQLIAAMQQRCGFEPGEVRVILLDAQPIHTRTQRYRLVDAATGEFERGTVRVADMVTRQPWADDVPVHVDPAREPSRPEISARPRRRRSRDTWS